MRATPFAVKVQFSANQERIGTPPWQVPKRNLWYLVPVIWMGHLVLFCKYALSAYK
jgi:hypothetical protein